MMIFGLYVPSYLSSLRVKNIRCSRSGFLDDFFCIYYMIDRHSGIHTLCCRSRRLEGEEEEEEVQ